MLILDIFIVLSLALVVGLLALGYAIKIKKKTKK
jgi:hypothetical protein